MRQERMDYLADRRETLDAEIRNHESEAKFHHRMAIQKQTVLDAMTDELYDLCDQERNENEPILVSSLSAYQFDDISTAIVADYERNSK